MQLLPLTRLLSLSQVIEGLHIAVASMRKGERARVTVGPKKAYGDEGVDFVPPKVLALPSEC